MSQSQAVVNRGGSEMSLEQTVVAVMAHWGSYKVPKSSRGKPWWLGNEFGANRCSSDGSLGVLQGPQVKPW